MAKKHQIDKAFTKGLMYEVALIVLFLGTLIASILHLIPEIYATEILSSVVFLGIIPVAKSAWESITQKQINVDLLATIALFFFTLCRRLKLRTFHQLNAFFGKNTWTFY